MNTKLKTLLLVSTIVLPLSACGHLHAKGGDMKDASGKQCVVSKNLAKAEKDLASVTKDLQSAADEANGPAKKNLHKLAKESAKLADKVANCKKICDAKGDKPAAAPTKHKKVHHVKPAAPAAAAPAATADDKNAK